MGGELVPQKRQRLKDSQPSHGIAYETAFLADADGGKTKPGGSDAGAEILVIGPDIASILNQSRLRIRLLPEEKKVSVLKLVKELIIGFGDGARRGRGRWMRILLLDLVLRTLLTCRSQSEDA